MTIQHDSGCHFRRVDRRKWILFGARTLEYWILSVNGSYSTKKAVFTPAQFRDLIRRQRRAPIVAFHTTYLVDRQEETRSVWVYRGRFFELRDSYSPTEVLGLIQALDAQTRQQMADAERVKAEDRERTRQIAKEHLES